MIRIHAKTKTPRFYVGFLRGKSVPNPYLHKPPGELYLYHLKQTKMNVLSEAGAYRTLVSLYDTQAKELLTAFNSNIRNASISISYRDERNRYQVTTLEIEPGNFDLKELINQLGAMTSALKMQAQDMLRALEGK